MVPPLSLFSYVDVNFIIYSRECCNVHAKPTKNMAKYGVYVYDLKFWVVSVLKVNNRKVILNFNIDNARINYS